jgi:hypothetical protein
VGGPTSPSEPHHPALQMKDIAIGVSENAAEDFRQAKWLA